MNKTILITGCSSGFGFLTAKLLQDSGYTVYPTVRNIKDLKILPNTLHLDVTWSQEKINQVISKLGRIDVLINNAGFGYLGAVESFSEAELRDQFETNLFGTFKVIQAVLPAMHDQKSGLIINISSIAGLVTSAFYGLYSSSKFALEALTTSLRAEESVYGITVVSVNPGSFGTSFWDNAKLPSTPNQYFDSLNTKFKALTHHSLHRRPHPSPVPAQIKAIIESAHPRKNYIVGLEANLLFFFHRLLPLGLQDWLVKRLIGKLV